MTLTKKKKKGGGGGLLLEEVVHSPSMGVFKYTGQLATKKGEIWWMEMKKEVHLITFTVPWTRYLTSFASVSSS